MKIEDLKFRYYNGEKECPFHAKSAYDGRPRWWHQESTVAHRPELAIEEFAERRDELPEYVKKYHGDADEGELAVVLTGYLNTRQWDITGTLVSDFDDYFDAPVNGYKAKPSK